ncbi:MAG: prepilin-type N-terminal cleavage/methylation domain-containing protein [Burkholderiaceae bacterium]|nr:prepilin-type N-terminal cleavage/methylation domain-containing protein [Burkholderiaceae bacterium]
MSRKNLGFTLIELLVAVAVMALLAMLSWRGLDGMTRVQSQTQAKTDGVLALQAGLAQWQTDLDALTQLPHVPGVSALDYDGQVLRLTRRYVDQGMTTTQASGNNNSNSNSESIRVVAWSQRDMDGKSQWLRWQSAPLRTRAELLAAWLQAAQWAQNPGDADKKHEVAIAAIDKWQIYYYRNDAWSNAMSSADAAAGSAQAALPDGVRLVLTLSSGQALTGNITRDWVSPTLGGGK